MTIRILAGDGKTEILWKSFLFPDGAVQVRIDKECLLHVAESYCIHYCAALKSSQEIMTLLSLRDAIGAASDGVAAHILHAHYLPYARQDRVCSEGEAYGARVFCRLIDGNFNRIRITDVHSNGSELFLNLNKKRVLPAPLEDLRNSGFLEGMEAIIAPDAGAYSRAKNAANLVGAQLIVCEKERNKETGAITSIGVPAAEIPKSVAIIDDICDGGGTFIAVAKSLRERGAKRVSLFVTHGIFSKGLSVFDGLIDEIATTNSYYDSESIGINLEIRKVK